MAYDLGRISIYQKTIELLFSSCIIIILVATGMKLYTKVLTTAKVMNMAVSEDAYCAKYDCIYYHAIKGGWPDDNRQALLAGVFQNIESHDHRDDSYVEKAVIKDGAIHVLGARDFSGKTLTLHPAFPAGDPFGPVQWIYGKPDNIEADLTVLGKDRTDPVIQAFSPFKR